MISADIWSELGLAPSSDRDAVRRAYGRRLRQVRPEDDPEGFKRLRDACEVAIAWLDTPSDPAASEAPPPLHAEGQITHWSRLEALIRKTASGHANENDLRTDLRALLQAPELDNLDTFQETGLRLACALVDISPNGDTLVHPVVAHFGWKGRSDWDDSPEVLHLQARSDGHGPRSASSIAGPCVALLAAPHPSNTARGAGIGTACDNSSRPPTSAKAGCWMNFIRRHSDGGRNTLMLMDEAPKQGRS